MRAVARPWVCRLQLSAGVMPQLIS